MPEGVDSSDTQSSELQEHVPKRLLWILSISLSFILVLILTAQWVSGHTTRIDSTQLIDQETVDIFLDEHWDERNEEDAVALPTGVFVQSLNLIDSSDVHVSLYVWQRRIDGVHDDVAEGFILPEQVDSKVLPREEYRVRQGNEEVIGWYFEGTIRQPFEFEDYPFDQKTVWIKVWPKEFNRNVVLVPDFAAYPCPEQPELTCTDTDDIFGIEQSIVLGEFERRNTYFDYALSEYSTNFGIDGYIGQAGFPELRYNMVIKRRVMSAFIINVVPLLVVAGLAFAVLMATTQSRNEASRLGFTTLGVIAAVSALAFVVLLAQVQMRAQFAESGFVYLETIYFLIYVVLLGVVVNAYMVNSERWSHLWVVRYGHHRKADLYEVLGRDLLPPAWTHHGDDEGQQRERQQGDAGPDGTEPDSRLEKDRDHKQHPSQKEVLEGGRGEPSHEMTVLEQRDTRQWRLIPRFTPLLPVQEDGDHDQPKGHQERRHRETEGHDVGAANGKFTFGIPPPIPASQDKAQDQRPQADDGKERTKPVNAALGITSRLPNVGNQWQDDNDDHHLPGKANAP